jgi:O-antigen/teichoic acid export membrane protein
LLKRLAVHHMTFLSILSGFMESVWGARARKKILPEAAQPLLPELRRAAMRNSTWMLASRVASQVFAASLTIIVARGLGEAGLGQYAFITSLLMIANIAATFGTDTYLIREVAAHPANTPGAVNSILSIQLTLSGLVILACWMALQAGYLPPATGQPLLVFVLSLLPLAFYSIFSSLLRAREQMDHYMLVTLVSSGLQASGAWLVIHLGGGLLGLAYLTLASSTLSSILAWQLCRRLAPGIPAIPEPPPYQAFVKVIKLAMPLALLTVIGVIYQRLAVLALAWLAGEAATGGYSASLRVVEVFKIVHISVLGGLFPIFARLQFQEDGLLAPDSRRFRSLSRWSLSLLVAASLIAALVLNLAAPVVINLVYGSGFEASIPILQTMAWILVPYAITSHQSLMLVARGKERRVLLATVLALTLLTSLSLALIPLMCAQGAARAALAGEIILAILLWIFRRLQEGRL